MHLAQCTWQTCALSKFKLKLDALLTHSYHSTSPVFELAGTFAHPAARNSAQQSFQRKNALQIQAHTTICKNNLKPHI